MTGARAREHSKAAAEVRLMFPCDVRQRRAGQHKATGAGERALLSPGCALCSTQPVLGNAG